MPALVWRPGVDELSVECVEHSQCAVVRLGGELDVAAAPLLCAELDALVASGSSRLILDLDAVEFLDAAGLGALVHVRGTAMEHAGWVRLVRVRPAAQRVLRLARLAGVLPVFASVELALGDTLLEPSPSLRMYKPFHIGTQDARDDCDASGDARQS